MKSYSELMQLETFEERFEYLRLRGRVGSETFGHNRYMNQWFYKTFEWLEIRDFIIQRDLGCDLGHPDFEINGPITIHHINPLTVEQVERRDPIALDPENLICVSDSTHKGIHYNTTQFLPQKVIVRTPNDTVPWKL